MTLKKKKLQGKYISEMFYYGFNEVIWWEAYKSLDINKGGQQMMATLLLDT